MSPQMNYIPARKPLETKKVGIYCRVSSNKATQLESLAAQISGLTKEVAKISKWILEDTFIDIASAKAGSNRREFNRMISQCESHNISIILTKSISRFGRDTVEALTAIQRIKAAGGRILFQEEGIDTDEYDSSFFSSILLSFAESDNESRSRNIRLGLSFKAATGTSKNFDKPIYGYKKDVDGKLIVYHEQSIVVRDIYSLYIKGESILGIKRILEANGVLSPTGRPTWSKKTIENILSNRKYTGMVTLSNSVDGSLYVLKQHHPAIITEYEFNTVQQIREERSNVITDETGTHRKSTKYSSKKKYRK